MQRPAQKSHTAPDGLAAGKTRDGLVYHCLKDGGGEIGGGCPLVDERLNIRFGKDAAAGGDGVELLIISRRVVEACGIGLQKGRHLVDEGAGAAGADAVHALLQPTGEIDDLRVFTAKLNGHIGLRRGILQSGSHRDYLLYKGDAQRLAEVDRSRAGNSRGKPARPCDGTRLFQKLGQRLLGVGHVAAVFLIDRTVFSIQHHEFYRRGADVDTRFVDLHINTPCFCPTTCCIISACSISLNFEILSDSFRGIVVKSCKESENE